MRTKSTTLEDLYQLYSHPSAVIFRAIELRNIYRNTVGVEFRHPSLDLGCGDGRIAKMLFEGSFTYGVDNGEAKDVEYAIKNKIYGQVFLESAEKLSLPNNSLNLVFSNCVIEHIPDNDAVLREVSRVLNAGGDFVFTVPSHKFKEFLFLTNKFLSIGLGGLSRLYKYRRNKMLNHFHCYSIIDWEQKLAKYGFKIVRHQYYISKETLMEWDKMALEVYFKKFINPNAEQAVLQKHIRKLEKLYIADSSIPDDNGAGLFIHCVKC